MLTALAATGNLPLPFWDRFLTSSGFAGVMAVIAATIAALIASAQLRHNKRQNERDRWWQTLTWVFERGAPGNNSDDKPLPQGVTFSLLTALHDQVRDRGGDPLRREAIASFLSMFDDTALQDSEDGEEAASIPGGTSSNDSGKPRTQGRYHEGPRQAGIIPVETVAAQELLNHLRDDLVEESPLDRARMYERSVHEALLRVARSSESVEVLGGRDNRDLGYDFALHSQTSTVAIEVKWSSRPLATANLLKWVGRRALTGRAVPVVIVANQPLSQAAQSRLSTLEAPVDYVVWRGPADDEMLIAALRVRLGPLE